MPNHIKPNNINMPKDSSLIYLTAKAVGNKLNTNREPSNGGIGIRLKMPNITFIIIACDNKNFIIITFAKIGILRNNANKTAIKIFANGPARPTQNTSFFGFFKKLKFIGTGFAHPNTTGECINNKKIGKMIVPTKSICAIGLKVRRPEYLAVGSPNLFATQPC